MTPFEWAYIVGSLGYAVVEWWLGSTKRVKPNSSIELLLTVARLLVRRK